MVFSNWSVCEGVDQAALYEEEEENQYETEDTNKKTNYSFSFQATHTIKSVADCELIICYGQAATSFIRTFIDIKAFDYIAQYNPIIRDDSDGNKKNQKQICELYKKGCLVLCLVQYQVAPQDSFSWTGSFKLFENINISKVSILCSSSKSIFVGNEEIKTSDVDFLRYLKNSECVDKVKNVIELEKGNLIRGLPAAVMRYCSAFKRSCIIYLAYTESHFVDVFTLKCFAPVLNDINLDKIADDILRKRLRDFEGCGVADNNVYI